MPYDSSNQGEYLTSQWIRTFKPGFIKDVRARLEQGFGQTKIREPIDLNFPLLLPQTRSPVEYPAIPGQIPPPWTTGYPPQSTTSSAAPDTTVGTTGGGGTTGGVTTAPTQGYTTGTTYGSTGGGGTTGGNTTGVGPGGTTAEGSTTGGGGTTTGSGGGYTTNNQGTINPNTTAASTTGGAGTTYGTGTYGTTDGSGTTGGTNYCGCPLSGGSWQSNIPGYGCPPFVLNGSTGETVFLCGANIVRICTGVQGIDCPEGCDPANNCFGCRTYLYQCCYDDNSQVVFEGCCCAVP